MENPGQFWVEINTTPTDCNIVDASAILCSFLDRNLMRMYNSERDRTDNRLPTLNT